MAYKYPTLPDVQVAVPVIADAIKNRDVPAKNVVHAIFVVEGYGLSMYPGDPAIFAASAKVYGKDEALADLELLAAPEGEKFAAKAIPWRLMFAVLAKLLEEYLNK